MQMLKGKIYFLNNGSVFDNSIVHEDILVPSSGTYF